MDPMTDEPNLESGSAAAPRGDSLDTVVRALRAAVPSVEAAVARVYSSPVGTESHTVAELLAAAAVPDLGDVVATHNTLTRAVAIVEDRKSVV